MKPAVAMEQNSRPIRVAIISPCFGVLGGLETFICALARSLVVLPGVEVTLCFKKTKTFELNWLLEKTATETGANVVFVERASRELARVIANSDIVHCQNPCFDIAFLAKAFRKPLVLTLHCQRPKSKGMWELSQFLTWQAADRRWYNSEFNWGTWDPRRKKKASARLPVVSDLPTGVVPVGQRKGFVFVARWIANKGVDILVEAYSRAKLDRKAWPLVLLGDGPLRPAIEAKIRDENIEGIEILGFVPEERRNDAIRHARFMVTPPNTKEDLGLTPMEARSVGVPVIITRDGGLPEAGGRHALICEPGNVQELRELLEKAAAMEIRDYEQLCEATRNELQEYLKPLSVYLDEYRVVLGWG